MEFWIGLIGFSLAAYSVVGNDSIQTLGTFMASNERVPWWGLWLFAGGILALTLILGYAGLGELLGGSGSADLTFGKYDGMFGGGKGFPTLSWWFVLPPLALLFITRWGLPVSTTFLVLSFFRIESLPDMLTKSLGGYGIAFAFAFAIYLTLIPRLERFFLEKPFAEGEGLLRNKQFWTVVQWVSTGFLWSQWLTQDLVNIIIYLGNPADISFGLFLVATGVLVGLLGLIFYQDGGKIQEIVRVKANSADIRSASLIDFFYAAALLLFKYDMAGLWSGKIPMSTTWVFLGLLAGREIAMRTRIPALRTGSVTNMVITDLGKATIGLVVSVMLVVILHFAEGKDLSALF
ncbi:MAG: hypothetical protein ACO3YQ_02875 [Flavobacteriales bacterium]